MKKDQGIDVRHSFGHSLLQSRKRKENNALNTTVRITLQSLFFFFIGVNITSALIFIWA